MGPVVVLKFRQFIGQANGWPTPAKLMLSGLLLLLSIALIVIIVEANICSSNGRDRYTFAKGVVGPCVPPMIVGPHATHCYDIQPNHERLSWIAAQDFCQAKGGGLLTLHTLEEVEFMVRKMVDQRIDVVYLGFHSVMNRSKWLWLDDNTETDPSVADWAPGQPDHWGGDEHCGSTFHEMDKSLAPVEGRKVLNDISCDKQMNIGFICKIPLS